MDARRRSAKNNVTWTHGTLHTFGSILNSGTSFKPEDTGEESGVHDLVIRKSEFERQASPCCHHLTVCLASPANRRWYMRAVGRAVKSNQTRKIIHRGTVGAAACDGTTKPASCYLPPGLSNTQGGSLAI